MSPRCNWSSVHQNNIKIVAFPMLLTSTHVLNLIPPGLPVTKLSWVVVSHFYRIRVAVLVLGLGRFLCAGVHHSSRHRARRVVVRPIGLGLGHGTVGGKGTVPPSQEEVNDASRDYDSQRNPQPKADLQSKRFVRARGGR